MKAIDCTTCDRFFPKSADGNMGDCRARPPLPVMVGAERTALGQRPVVDTYFPTVGRGIFCGEHPDAPRRREPALAFESVIQPRGPASPLIGPKDMSRTISSDDETKGNA